MFCGRAVPNVSGRKAKASAPARMAGRPRTTMGRGGQSEARLDTNGQTRPKRRAGEKEG